MSTEHVDLWRDKYSLAVKRINEQRAELDALRAERERQKIDERQLRAEREYYRDLADALRAERDELHKALDRLLNIARAYGSEAE